MARGAKLRSGLGVTAVIAALLISSTLLIIGSQSGNIAHLDNAPSSFNDGMRAPAISCSIDSSVVEVGTSVHVTGVLERRTFFSAAPIMGAAVGLSVTLPNGSTAYSVQGPSTVTSPDGTFAFDYVPPTAGPYVARVTYAGSQVYGETTSTVPFFTFDAKASDPKVALSRPTTPIAIFDYTVAVNKVMDTSGNMVYSGTPMEAIQYALSQTPVGGAIHLEAGEYNISQNLFVSRSLIGSGNDTKLVADGTNVESMLQLRNTDGSVLNGVTISNMQLDGQGAKFPSASYGGLEVVRSSNCVLDNLYIHDMPNSHGIELQGSSNNTIRDCVIANVGYDGHYGSGICSGTLLPGESSSFNAVYGCIITGCSMAGIDWEPGNDNTVLDTTIKELTSWTGGPAVGISIWNQNGWSASSNNQFYNVLVETTGVGADSDSVTGTVFQGCILMGSKSSAIYATNCSNWQIRDSTFLTNGGNGVFFDKGGSNNLVGRCIIEDTSGTRSGYGVVMNSDSAHPSPGNTVSGNYIFKTVRAISFGPDTTKSTIANNVETDCRYADSIPSTNAVSGTIRN